MSDHAIGGEMSLPSQVYNAGIALWLLNAVELMRMLPSSRANASAAVTVAVSAAAISAGWLNRLMPPPDSENESPAIRDTSSALCSCALLVAGHHHLCNLHGRTSN